MTEIIDLTLSPPPDIIEISSDQGSSPPHRYPTKENKKWKKRIPNGRASDGGSAQPSRAHSQETGNKRVEPSEPTPHVESVEGTTQISSSATDESGLFIFDGAPAPMVVKDVPPSPGAAESNGASNKLLLPSHVAILCDDAVVDVIPPPKLSTDDEECIEYLDYEDRKAPGLVRYFDVNGEQASQSKPSISKCKKCGAEGDHKTYECSTQICLTCGARDEHSTRSCPISKTCYTCGMKGHINKTCPNRFAAHLASPDLLGDCNRCGSTEHKVNECPTLWRIYQYMNDEERIMIIESREERKPLAIGEGGEGYIGRELWCYNCAYTGHLGDDCDELPHPATFPTEFSAFSFHNIMSGPFYDPATEPVPLKLGSKEQKIRADQPHLADGWDADAPIDVGKRGKNKDKERLEKRFREQEEDGEDWFNDTRNMKRRGLDQPIRLPEPRAKTLKFGQFKDGNPERSSPQPTSTSGPSLLARLSGAHSGRPRGKNDHSHGRQDPSHPFENSIRIRGAANDARSQGGKYSSSRKTDSDRGQDRRDRDNPGHRGSRRDHGPRYRGGYGR